MSYEPNIDVKALVAIDTHVHIDIDDRGGRALPRDLVDAAARYFRAPTGRLTIDEIAEIYRERSMAAVVFTVDATTALGERPNSSIDIARGAARNNDVLIPFGSVDPHATDAATRARRLVVEEGVRGFKFHPSVQDFDPSSEAYFPIYQTLEDLAVPAVFHTGQTGIGAGMRGGRGVRLALSNPMLLDTVAAAFPGLDIVMAHPAIPWLEEQLAVAVHKANTWIDLSGWSPRYFPAQMVRQANSILQDKVLFGSDYPMIPSDRWLEEFDELPMKEQVRAKILLENAKRLLKLA